MPAIETEELELLAEGPRLCRRDTPHQVVERVLGHWSPIIYRDALATRDEVLAFCQLADVYVITPLHDGMNLVVKEYVAARRIMETAG